MVREVQVVHLGRLTMVAAHGVDPGFEPAILGLRTEPLVGDGNRLEHLGPRHPAEGVVALRIAPCRCEALQLLDQSGALALERLREFAQVVQAEPEPDPGHQRLLRDAQATRQPAAQVGRGVQVGDTDRGDIQAVKGQQMKTCCRVVDRAGFAPIAPEQVHGDMLGPPWLTR